MKNNIMFNPISKMASYGIHFEEIVEALQKVNKNVGGGYIAQTAEQFLVQGIGLFKSTADIEKVPIKQLDSFRVIKVSDIAKVRLGKELRTGAATTNGEETVLGTVMMLMGENSRTVSTRVKEKNRRNSKNLARRYRNANRVQSLGSCHATLGTVEHNLMLGATLVIIVVVLIDRKYSSSGDHCNHNSLVVVNDIFNYAAFGIFWKFDEFGGPWISVSSSTAQ